MAEQKQNLTWRKRLWRALMTPVGKRVPVGKNGAPHGIALFLVIVSLGLMSAVVVDFNYNEIIRYRLAMHERDSLKAEALAHSGLSFSRLLLSVQSAIQPMITQVAAMGAPLPAYTVWELAPIDCELMRGLADGHLQSAFGLDVSAAVAARAEAHAEKTQERLDDFDSAKEGAGDGPFEPPASGYGAFTGTCGVEIVDEERKPVSLRGWAGQLNAQARFAYAQRLFAVFQPERYDFLFEERDARGDRVTREELVANIYDWIDQNEDATDPRAEPVNWGRQGGGAEEGSYTSYDPEIEPKNAHFDSPGEIRMVHGWTDAHSKAFADQISIYGEAKVNILSAPPQSIETLVRMCAANPTDLLLLDPLWMQETLQLWQQCKQLGVLGGCAPLNPDGFVQFLQGRGLTLEEQLCKDNISTESKNFTIRASGTVGDVSRTLTVVVRTASATEEFYYFGIR
jgi:hypothetical protein